MDRETAHHALHGRAYGMKKHDATRLHYDLRLECNGVLLSWALAKDFCCGPEVMCEAVEMDDHRKAYLSFEGVHRTGPIMLWDRGMWAPHPECVDIQNSLREGILRFTLLGEKLQGIWKLMRTNRTSNERPVWRLHKEGERCAGRCVLEEQPNSVSTGRTMESIVHDWTNPVDRYRRQIHLFGDTTALSTIAT